jgi:DNA-binding response OmpR family regulator
MTETSFLRKKRVLVVDDEADLLELLRVHLKEQGFAIATASNGIDAVRKARSLRPDLILLDVMLPELDGFQVCETLRKDPELARVPIVMLTGLAGEMTRCAGIDSGATDFVTKPITPREIVLKIKEILLEQAVGITRPAAAEQN